MAACAAGLGALQGEGTEETVRCHLLEVKIKVDECVLDNENIEFEAHRSHTVVEILDF